MTENIMEKGNEAENANEDTVMADEVNTTEDAIKDPAPEQQQQKKKKKKKKRVRSQASFDRRKERARLRSMGLPVPTPPPQQVCDPALPLERKRNKKRAKKAKKAAYEAAKRAAKQAEEGPVAASTSLPANAHPTAPENDTVIIPDVEDERMEDDNAEMDLDPAPTMTLVYRGKTG